MAAAAPATAGKYSADVATAPNLAIPHEPWAPSAKAERGATAAARDLALNQQWKKHPRYGPSQAAHLIDDVHGYFRQSFQSLCKSYKKTGAVDRLAFRRVLRQLEGHHNGEDHSWFPRMMRQFPETVAAFDYLSADHQHLHPLEMQVLALPAPEAAATGEENPDRASGEALLEFTSFLADHLNREKMVVVPLLLRGR